MVKDKTDWESWAYESPVRLLTLIILSIVLAELLLGLSSPYFFQYPAWAQPLIHSALLILALFPTLYLFWLRPLNHQRSELRREKIQAAIYRISETALSAPNLQHLIRSIHTIINELMPARNFFVALHEPATDTLTFPYFVDEKDPERKSRKAGR